MPGDFDDRLAAVDDALGASAGSSASGGDQREAAGGDARGRDSGAGVDDAAGVSSSADAGAAVDDSMVDAGVSADVAALTERVAELEAAVQALRGYAGSVRAVNDRVEERADAAVATTDALRDRVDELARRVDGGERPAGGARRGRGRGAGGGASRRDGSPGRAGEGSCERTTERRDTRTHQRGRAGVTGSDSGSSTAGGGSGVAWPPDDPREPYGDVDADDDRERAGLVARLRDAL